MLLRVMQRVLILRLLGWTLLLAQMWMLVDAGTSEDVWKRAESYDTISQTLQNLLIEEKSLNRQFLRERSQNWFQDRKSTVHRDAVYEGYLGCNPERVLHVISLIRSKLESDALTCMDNIFAESEDIHNESVKVSQAAQKLAKSLQRRSDLESGHFDAILECLPDPNTVARAEQYTPPRIGRIAATAPIIISTWGTFRNSFQEKRGACFEFHELEYHGATADIVYLFEECVRGDMKDWTDPEVTPTETELQSFFKVVLHHAYSRPAEFKRSLTGMFDNAIQMSITTVRKSHVVQAIELLEQYESRQGSAAQCRFYLPRLKTLYSDLIRDAYRCLHGTYMYYLDSQKLIELDAGDINRLATNSSHQMIDLQRANLTMTEAVHHIQNKVIPPYTSAKNKEFAMEEQYANDVLNIKTHLEKAFQCVQNTQYSFDKVSLQLSKAYTKCPNRISKQQILINKLESDASNVFLRTDKLFDTALSGAFRNLENWRNRQESLLTIIPKTTPVCQTHCATKAYTQITKLHDDSRLECTRHLTKLKIQLKDAAERAEYLRRLILNSDEEDLAHQCRQQAILLSDPTAENFQINNKSCGEVFDSHIDNQSIIGEFRNCFKFKCSRTWRYIFGKADYESEMLAGDIL